MEDKEQLCNNKCSCRIDYMILTHVHYDHAGSAANEDTRIKVIHTPGHSPGSQSIIVDDEIALVGDTMFGVFKDSVFPPFADDGDETVRSWGKLLKTNCRIFLPSHGTENIRELVERDYLRRIDSIQL